MDEKEKTGENPGKQFAASVLKSAMLYDPGTAKVSPGAMKAAGAEQIAEILYCFSCGSMGFADDMDSTGENRDALKHALKEETRAEIKRAREQNKSILKNHTPGETAAAVFGECGGLVVYAYFPLQAGGKPETRILTLKEVRENAAGCYDAAIGMGNLTAANDWQNLINGIDTTQDFINFLCESGFYD